jgi:acetyltransferase-like isoleucine patch superfamily enzyme
MGDMPNRTVNAVHARRALVPDPAHERELATHLRESYGREALQELYGRFVDGEAAFDAMMRRVLWRALARRAGDALRVERGAQFRHIETFELGEGVFIGERAFIQGRFDGTCVIGDRTWVGPQVYLDARDLIIEASVGLAPGVKLLGSAHTGHPVDVPVIQTDLDIKPVRIGAGADVGVNAVVLPGVTIGRGAIIGAGAVVTKDVPAFAVAAGVPAAVLRYREGHGGG